MQDCRPFIICTSLSVNYISLQGGSHLCSKQYTVTRDNVSVKIVDPYMASYSMESVIYAAIQVVHTTTRISLIILEPIFASKQQIFPFIERVSAFLIKFRVLLPDQIQLMIHIYSCSWLAFLGRHKCSSRCMEQLLSKGAKL